jgi:hypothetical protein
MKEGEILLESFGPVRLEKKLVKIKISPGE